MAEENTNNFSFTNIFQEKNVNSSTINDNQALKVFNGDFNDLKTCQMVIKKQKAVIEACMKEIEYLKSISSNSNILNNNTNNVNNNAKIDRALEIIKIL